MKKQVLIGALCTMLWAGPAHAITTKEVLQNPILWSSLASAGLTALYPYVGKRSLPRSWAAAGAAAGGIGYMGWAMWQANKNGDLSLLKTIKKPYLSRTDQEQEELEQFVRDRDLKNETVARKYIWAKIHHVIASAIFAASQYGVHRYWLDRSVAEVDARARVIQSVSVYNDIIKSTHESIDDIKKLGVHWLEGPFLEGLVFPSDNIAPADIDKRLDLLAKKLSGGPMKAEHMKKISRSSEKVMSVHAKVLTDRSVSQEEKQKILEPYLKALRYKVFADLALGLMNLREHHDRMPIALTAD